MAEATAIVIDNGSKYIKAGMSGEDKPRKILLSVVDKPRRRSSIYKPTPFTQAAIKERRFSARSYGKNVFGCLSYPIQQGIIINWDDMV